METWQLFLIIGTLFTTLASFVWLAYELSSLKSKSRSSKDGSPKNVTEASVNVAINQAFTEEFREELRQRARQQFEKLIQDNAMFLQQDVRVSAARLDEFMKKEIVATLQQELAKHHQTLDQTKQLFDQSMTQTRQELEKSITSEKEQRLKQLDENMPKIIQAYVQEAVGDILDNDKQLALIIDGLHAKKAEIFEDMRRRA